MTNRTPRATYNRAGEVELRFPYDDCLIAALKLQIPAHARSYDPAEKTWTVTSVYANRAVDLLLLYFRDARVDRPGARPGAAPQDSAARPYAALHLLPSAPPELIEGAYRILAKLSHPDGGGSDEAMRSLNEAHDALKALVAA